MSDASRRVLRSFGVQEPSQSLVTVLDAWIASGHAVINHPHVAQSARAGNTNEFLKALRQLENGDVGGSGHSRSRGDTGGPTYTADQWDAVVKCVHDKGHLYANPGERGAGHVGDEALQDLIDCSKTQGVDLSTFDLTVYKDKTLSDIRDALAALKIIPPVDVVPALTDALNLMKWITDPAHWLWILVGVVGAACVAFGARNLMDSLA